jgi:hypothetical protein
MRPGTLKGGVVRSKLWPEDYVKISLFSSLPYSKEQVWRVERMSRCRRFAACKLVGGCLGRWFPVGDLSRVIAGSYAGIYVGDAR